jgi:hypothetical protein
MTLTGIVVHGHGDEAFVQYSNELWPNDPNFTIRLLLRFFRNLEKEQVREFEVLLEFEPQTHSFNKFCREVFVV